MKNLRKFVVLLLVVVMLAASVPLQVLSAMDSTYYHIKFTLTFYGSDPTPVTVYYNEKDPGIFTSYRITHTFTVSPDSMTSDFGDSATCIKTYLGGGVWKYEIETMDGAYSPIASDSLPFFAVSRSTLDGLWYCDYWDWNNLIYQPGQYAVVSSVDNRHDEKTIITYERSFFLTSSKATSNSMTINRFFGASTSAVDSTFDIYRYYDMNNDYSLFKTVTIPAAQASTTVSGLYGGTYFVKQQLPAHYGDEVTSGTPATNALGSGAQISLSDNGGTSASVSFADTYYAPVFYNVNLSQPDGGTITSDVSQAPEGDTVSLTVTPDADMMLTPGSLKYNDGAEHSISGTSFVMPQSAVTVSAQFERKEYSVTIGSLSGGSITPSTSTAISGTTVDLTVIPEPGMALKPGTLKYNDGSDHVITGTSFDMPQNDVTVSAEFERPVTVTTTELPDGKLGEAYSYTLAAANGTSPYTWDITSDSLPNGLTLSSEGVLSGTPSETGPFPVTFTVTDANDVSFSKTLTLTIRLGNGNGGYEVTPDTDSAYTAGLTADRLATMTVSSGVKGFTFFWVTLSPVKGHSGSEVCIFVQLRNGQQVAIAATAADFDTVTRASAAFNVKPGDVIKVYIVDNLSNAAGTNPTIL